MARKSLKQKIAKQRKQIDDMDIRPGDILFLSYLRRFVEERLDDIEYEIDTGSRYDDLLETELDVLNELLDVMENYGQR